MIWKVEAEGDRVFVEADTIDKAEKKFRDAFGDVPKNLVTWTKVDEIPEGEEAIGF